MDSPSFPCFLSLPALQTMQAVSSAALPRSWVDAPHATNEHAHTATKPQHHHPHPQQRHHHSEPALNTPSLQHTLAALLDCLQLEDTPTGSHMTTATNALASGASAPPLNHNSAAGPLPLQPTLPWPTAPCSQPSQGLSQSLGPPTLSALLSPLSPITTASPIKHSINSSGSGASGASALPHHHTPCLLSLSLLSQSQSAQCTHSGVRSSSQASALAPLSGASQTLQSAGFGSCGSYGSFGSGWEGGAAGSADSEGGGGGRGAGVLGLSAAGLWGVYGLQRRVLAALASMLAGEVQTAFIRLRS